MPRTLSATSTGWSRGVGNAEVAGEHPGLAPLPGGVVHAKSVAVGLAGIGWEEAPGDDRLDGGVADATGAPVHDGGELAVFGEQVEIREVTVEPDGWAVVVGGSHDPVPGCGDRIGVDLVTDSGDAPAHHLVAETDRMPTTVRRSVRGVEVRAHR
jgi:hypothetical protein